MLRCCKSALLHLLSLSLAASVLAQTPPPASTADAPVPVAKAAPVTDSNHILSAQDVVEISVFQEEELGVKSRISEDGTIQMPLIGTVRIAGRSVREAQ